MNKIGETTVARNMRDGWAAKTRFDLGTQTKEGKHVLIIETSKRHNGGISTLASVHTDTGSSYMHAFSLGGPGGDFSKTVAKSQAKGTEKAIRTLHDEALASIDAIEADARAHYAVRDKTKELSEKRDKVLEIADATGVTELPPMERAQAEVDITRSLS